MHDLVFEALSAAAHKPEFNVLDTDILRCYDSITRNLQPDEFGRVDAQQVHEAVKQIAEKSPALFRPLETDWSKMDPERFDAEEKRFRESLRIRPEVPQNEFRALDAALLSDVESNALRRHLGGRGSSYERSILRAALARQQRELGGVA